MTVLKVYVSPHHFDENSFTRKPAQDVLPGGTGIQPAHGSLSICGGRRAGLNAAANAGCGMLYLSDDGKEPELAEYPKPYFRAKSLYECRSERAYREWEAAA